MHLKIVGIVSAKIGFPMTSGEVEGGGGGGGRLRTLRSATKRFFIDAFPKYR